MPRGKSLHAVATDRCAPRREAQEAHLVCGFRSRIRPSRRARGHQERSIYPSIYQSCMRVRPNARARRHCPSGRSGWSARNGRPPASMDQQLLAIIQRDGNALASVSSRAASIRHASLPAALVDPLVSSAAPRPGGEAGGRAVLACTQHVSPARRFRTSTTIVFINPQFLCLCGPGPGPG